MSLRIVKRSMAVMAVMLSFSSSVQAGLFDGWNCHMPVTVNGYKDYEPLTNFPLLIVLNTNLAGFNYKQFAYSDGRDLRFTDSTGSNELMYEVDHWDTKGNSYIWVKIPVLIGTNDTNYFDGQWIRNWSWTAEPMIARIYPNGVKWMQYHGDNGSKNFAVASWMGADGYPFRHQLLFAEGDPALGWTYASRPAAVTAGHTENQLLGRWIYNDAPKYLHFHNGYRYASDSQTTGGNYWDPINLSVLYYMNGSVTNFLTNELDRLLFAERDPRVYPTPNVDVVYNTNTQYVQIIAHWGSPSVTNIAYTNNGAVWSGNSMAGVWHMREAAAKDSKGNATAGTPNNITVTNGKFGVGLHFNSALSSHINFGTFTPGTISGNAGYTIEGWFYRTGNGGANIVYGDSTNLHAAGLGVNGNGQYTSIHNGTDETFDNSTYVNGQWQHVMLVHHKGDDSFNDLIYINGRYSNSRGNDTGSGGPTHNTASCLSLPGNGSLSFGKSPWGSDYTGTQIMDEIRIHRAERNYPWIQATYQTMVSNNSFQTYSTVQGFTNILYGGTNPPGAFQFSSATYNVNETGRYVDVVIQRPLDAGSNVSVQVTANGGTAVADTDYVTGNATVSMSDGESSATFRVYVANNAVDDGDRTLSLLLSNPTGGATITSPSNTTLTIQDDDSSTLSNVLISYGTMWKYFATNSSTDPGAGWAATNFNEAIWDTGAAPLGYGVPDETTTLLSYGSDAANKIPAYYFRKKFVVVDPASIGLVTLKTRVDDGCVIYINGTEVPGARYLMTNGAITYQTFATNAAPNGKPEQLFSASPSLLQAGTNVIAVEVHQVGPGSSDVYLDMQVEATAASTNSEFTAYNDIGWTSGQLSTNITTFSPAGTSSGFLMDHNSGSPLAVQASITCSTSGGFFNNPANLEAATPAQLVFTNSVSLDGYFNWSQGTVTLTLSNLDPARQYSLVLFGSRGQSSYTYRWCDVRITDVSNFVNNSSAGTTLSTVSLPNDQGRILAANTEGRVWKYDAIQPGSDGDVTFLVTSGGSTSTGGYLNAFMLQTYTNVTGDSDADGMDDTWEQTYFGGTSTTNGGMLEDYDGDGFDNYSEFRAGTDPTSTSSRLAFSGGNASSSNGLVVTWSSVNGRLYSIQTSSNLVTSWTVQQSGIAATPPLNVVTTALSPGHGYLRVKVE